MINGNKAELPLITFLLASRKRMAQLLDTTVQQAGLEFYRRIQALREPVVISKADAPVKEIVQQGKDIDLRRYPALVHHYMDPGPYITAGFFTVMDPDTGIPNCAFHRGWIKGRDEIRSYLTPSTHNGLILEKHERAGKDMRVAYWIGHHPLAILGAQIHVPMSVSHYASAGGLLGEPLRLVPSETLGDDFLVPADAEVIIEGIMPCGERRAEGPFGEYPRHIGPQRLSPYFKVTAVTRKKNAYWDYAGQAWAQTIVNLFGSFETMFLVHLTFGVLMLLSSAYHLVWLVGLFATKGPATSMVSARKDLKDAIAHLKYLLGLSHHPPQFDRYTWLEKFEYYAVFWGIFVMGSTGAMLWFPNIVIKLLPRWVLDVSRVVHSNEAFVCMLAVFIGHFFAAHYNPRVFPSSKVWLTGEISMEHLAAEHPLLYTFLKLLFI